MPSYTDLQTYRKCPRLYGFKLLGYSSVETPEPMQTGQFVHKAIAAHFRGTDWRQAIVSTGEETIARLGRIGDVEKQGKALKELGISVKRASELAQRYIEHWAGDYKACLVEPELKLGNVVCHPDLIATIPNEDRTIEFYHRVIVDLKTSKSPDMRWYDVSGQCDLYAYMIKEFNKQYYHQEIDLIIYDVISEEGIYRHTRPPRLEAGERLYERVKRLPTVKLDDALNAFLVLNNPHFAFDCPNRCLFWEPCWLLETADWDACKDHLEANYIKEG